MQNGSKDLNENSGDGIVTLEASIGDLGCDGVLDERIELWHVVGIESKINLFVLTIFDVLLFQFEGCQF